MSFVPESVLKKRRTQAAIATEQEAAATKAKAAAAAKKEVTFKRAEKYMAEYKAAENDAIRLRREAKAANSIYVPPEGKLAFVIRIRGIIGMSPKFYIAYGEPNLKSVRECIYKRGYGKVNKKRVPIDNNAVAEDVLGKHDIICAEDLIHEIYTVGPHFREAANFLWPVKLSSPTGGFKAKLLHYNEGGDAGYRGEKIHELVKKML
ncbi:hypothetical protein JL720_17236 [Aureococcus anophagefferens]|nr:hypothetical protein JL720_17236 [Aureococcus anophagefferens]